MGDVLSLGICCQSFPDGAMLGFSSLIQTEIWNGIKLLVKVKKKVMVHPQFSRQTMVDILWLVFQLQTLPELIFMMFWFLNSIQRGTCRGMKPLEEVKAILQIQSGKQVMGDILSPEEQPQKAQGLMMSGF